LKDYYRQKRPQEIQAVQSPHAFLLTNEADKASGLPMTDWLIFWKIVEENRTPDKIMLTKYSDSAGYFLTDLLNPNNSSVVNS
jgi:hypothetical protein